MKIEIGQYQKKPKSNELLIFGVFNKDKDSFLIEDHIKELNKELNDSLFILVKEEKFTGEFGKVLFLQTLNKDKSQKIALLGLGDPKKIETEHFRKAGSESLRLAENKKSKNFSFIVPKNTPTPSFDVVDALATGALLSSYKFDKYLTKDKADFKIDSFNILLNEKIQKDKEIALKRAQTICESVFLARDLINESPSICTPDYIAKTAQKVAKEHDLEIEILDETKLKKQNFNLLLAVGQASSEKIPPRLIKLSYEPKNYKKTIAIVGKGVTFDSGGLNIKPPDGMLDMKVDMSGAAAVLGAIKALSILKPKTKVVALMPCVENGVGPSSYHQGDIIISKKGLSVEITNTDAEGRLILADAFTYVQEKDSPDILIDLATLTGACMVALGRNTAGLFSNDDDLADDLILCGKAQGEAYWRLPLCESLQEGLKSPQADLKNCADRFGGSITAALFLKAFVEEKTKWIHLDIAGPATNVKNNFYHTIGGEGFGIRTLVDFIMEQT